MIVNLTGSILRIQDLKPGAILTAYGAVYLLTDRCEGDKPHTVWCVNLETGCMRNFHVQSADFEIVRNVELTGDRGSVKND